MKDAAVGSMPARMWSGKELATNSARRGQLAWHFASTSSISTIRAGGKAPGNDEVARAANAKGALLQQSNAAGAWRTVGQVRSGGTALSLALRANTAFRLLLPGTIHRAIYKALYERRDQPPTMQEVQRQVRAELGDEAADQVHFSKRLRELRNSFEIPPATAANGFTYLLAGRRAQPKAEEQISKRLLSWASVLDPATLARDVKVLGAGGYDTPPEN